VRLPEQTACVSSCRITAECLCKFAVGISIKVSHRTSHLGKPSIKYRASIVFQIVAPLAIMPRPQVPSPSGTKSRLCVFAAIQSHCLTQIHYDSPLECLASIAMSPHSCKVSCHSSCRPDIRDLSETRLILKLFGNNGSHEHNANLAHLVKTPELHLSSSVIVLSRQFGHREQSGIQQTTWHASRKDIIATRADTCVKFNAVIGFSQSNDGPSGFAPRAKIAPSHCHRARSSETAATMPIQTAQ